MRIVALNHPLAEVLDALGGGDDVWAVAPSGAIVAERDPNLLRFIRGIARDGVDFTQLVEVRPDLILTTVTESDSAAFCRWAEQLLADRLAQPVRVVSVNPTSLESVYDSFEQVGQAVGRAREGRELANRIKAQLSDWADNFYSRMKGKRVSVISSVVPLHHAGRWIPDLVRLGSAQPQHTDTRAPFYTGTWRELLDFRPDVVIVALHGLSVMECVQCLPVLEGIAEWGSFPAVKRGEVIFCDGLSLYSPAPRLVRGVAVLFSAIAGLESGYITKREEFFKLRYVELHRHRLLGT
jgi:ABC-type Fe3+-hydroxamate transport system substrate-binding protein